MAGLDFGFISNFIKYNMAPWLNNTLKSTTWTAILTTLIICFIIMVMYPTKKNPPRNKLARTFVYIFIANLIILFMHDTYLLDQVKNRVNELDANQIVGGLQIFNQENRSANIYDILPKTEDSTE